MSEYSISNVSKDKLLFPGKIAVVTSYPSVNEDDYHSVDHVIAKYGLDKIIHRTWPTNFMDDHKTIQNIFTELAADKEVKAFILNQALPGSNAAVDKLRETRDDIFIVYCLAHEPTIDSVTRANLILRTNDLAMGPAMVTQAKKQNAKVFVHYSFPRHMLMPIFAARFNIIKEICAAEGIEFIAVEALDPIGEAGIAAAQKFIYDDVHRIVSSYGEDTAFFCTNCTLQIPLIKAVIDSHAIFPQPCCPSPYHGFPEAFGIDMEKRRPDLLYLISEACRIAEEKGMTDRLSTWPVSASMLATTAGAEYAIKWIKGDVEKAGIDNKVLLNCMNTYIEDAVGEESCVLLDSHSEGGVTYSNFKLVLMSYLDF
jgi:hypothetical protein